MNFEIAWRQVGSKRMLGILKNYHELLTNDNFILFFADLVETYALDVDEFDLLSQTTDERSEMKGEQDTTLESAGGSSEKLSQASGSSMLKAEISSDFVYQLTTVKSLSVMPSP